MKKNIPPKFSYTIKDKAREKAREERTMEPLPSKYMHSTINLNSESWMYIFIYEYYKSPIL